VLQHPPTGIVNKQSTKLSMMGRIEYLLLVGLVTLPRVSVADTLAFEPPVSLGEAGWGVDKGFSFGMGELAVQSGDTVYANHTFIALNRFALCLHRRRIASKTVAIVACAMVSGNVCVGVRACVCV
jgi:hypothetical protein